MKERNNRAFLYGESVFTTLLIEDGKPKYWNKHLERLKRGIEFVFGPFPGEPNWTKSLEERVLNETSKIKDIRVLRITVFLGNSERGLHRSVTSFDDLSFDFMYSDLPRKSENINLRSVEVIPRASWWPDFLKSGNYLETILSQKMFLTQDDHDVLFTTQTGEVLETSVANIFIYQNGELLTAPTGANVLSGVMRSEVLERAHKFFDKVDVRGVSLSEAKKSQGIFGTNSIRGLFLVTKIDDDKIDNSKDFLERFEKLRRELV